tara:strand:- start:7327 stop:8514 length:1188 start_codon:yes stop_codon:yes gene_type:complete
LFTNRKLISLFRYLKNPIPPPFYWRFGQKPIKRYKKFFLKNIPLEIIQQIYWWLRISIFYQIPKFHKYKLPFLFKLKANLINPFTYSECICWNQLGVKTWAELSDKCPAALNYFRHKDRHERISIPTKKDQGLLKNKVSLLKIIPKENSYPVYMSKSIIHDFSFHNCESRWIFENLNKNGLILKPNSSSNSLGVIQFKIIRDYLCYKYQNNSFENFKKLVPYNQKINIYQIFSFWRELTNINSESLAMPYLTCENDFFESHQNLNLRVITKKNFSNSQISLKNSYLPIYISNEFQTIFHYTGDFLPLFLNKLSQDNLLEIEKWRLFLKNDRPKTIDDCIDKSILFHSYIPSIDEIAWDWIPCKNNPKLLEGNYFYGKFIPDMLDHYMSKKSNLLF